MPDLEPMSGRPRLFGADYSVYVRIARLALTEKNVAYDLVPVDVFASDGVPDWYLKYHPFGLIPAFEHVALRLYETTAITHYIDEAFDGPALQPESPAKRALMNQIIAMLDSHAYRSLVWGVYVERVSKPQRGEAPNEAQIAGSLEKARVFLAALGALKRQGRWLLGEQLTLADLHAAPMFAYFQLAPEGRTLLAEYPLLAAWWENVRSLPSLGATQSH